MPDLRKLESYSRADIVRIHMQNQNQLPSFQLTAHIIHKQYLFNINSN